MAEEFPRALLSLPGLGLFERPSCEQPAAASPTRGCGDSREAFGAPPPPRVALFTTEGRG